MRKLVCFFVVLLIGLNHSSAKEKQRPDSEYQDGVLLSFRTVANGNNCSSSESVKGAVDDGGKVDATADSSGVCRDTTIRLYTVKIGDTTYVLKPLPIAWNRPSVLANELPGTRLKSRTEKRKLFIKIGTHETPFSIEEAH